MIFAAILATVLHTAIAAYLLIRNADKKANWTIRLHRAVLGEFAVFVVALFCAAAFVAATRSVSLLSTMEIFVVTPVLFLLLCWIGQYRLIFYLSTYRGRRRFFQPWELRRIGFITMLQIIFYYICLSLVALGALTYAEWAKQSAETPAMQKLAAGIYPGNIHKFLCHAKVEPSALQAAASRPGRPRS
ncbi:MAG: hypothetical protein Q7R45_17805 [Sulfuricaulis sp.]|nr:hypothetical protein [Sulfuricaulis sp.]